MPSLYYDGAMWICLLACTKANPEPAVEDCSALSSELTRLAGGETVPGIDLDKAGRVQVVVEPDVADLPASFDEEVRAGGMVQGWVRPAELCVLAGAAGVEGVRTPVRASPK